jgi:hypothetical protein
MLASANPVRTLDPPRLSDPAMADADRGGAPVSEVVRHSRLERRT